MDDKIIVSNRSALTTKYTSAGVTKIRAAIGALIAADKERAVTTRLVFLDDAKAMKAFKGKAVTDPASPRQNKEAIDAIFGKADPEYLMILGAPDVVPQQDMKNPLFDAIEDPDEIAWGDLPYACDAPYSKDIAAFSGPTRVVGRLPDLTGADDPSHLIALLGHAAKYKSKPVLSYGKYFGLSTQSWRKSTELSLFNVFGEAKALTLAPPSGPNHSASRLAPLMHFVNCHGGDADPYFYGEKGKSQPPSLGSKEIAKKIKLGTVAAVECCYGAQMYDSITLALPLPICQHYLRQGAYGYFGSSTIAYGPANENGLADFIAQYFLLSILDGASLGRAALVARQRFIQQAGELDPADLKTLAQFSLLGDPSIQAAAVPTPTETPKNIDAAMAQRQGRRERRTKLRDLGQMLKATKPTASRKVTGVRRSKTVQQALRNIARQAGIGPSKEFTAFAVKVPAGARSKSGKGAVAAARYYVAARPDKSRPKVDDRHPSVIAVAKEVDGRIIGYRIYTER